VIIAVISTVALAAVLAGGLLVCMRWAMARTDGYIAASDMVNQVTRQRDEALERAQALSDLNQAFKLRLSATQEALSRAQKERNDALVHGANASAGAAAAALDGLLATPLPGVAIGADDHDREAAAAVPAPPVADAGDPGRSS
jgi:hypothetical protein